MSDAGTIARETTPSRTRQTRTLEDTNKLEALDSSIAPSVARVVKSERDYRLDFCRGLALIVIFIDHVPGNPLSNWTLRKFAFCDAAEVFVLISGISSYLAYGGKLEREGFLRCSGIIGRRWIKIYYSHLLLLFTVALALLVAGWSLGRAEYLDFLRMRWLFDAPRDAILAAVTLRFLPNNLDILPLYLILLALAPGVIWMVKRDMRVALGASLAIYLMTRWTGFNLPAGNQGEVWYFNPFAWQLLYVIGITIGHLSKTKPIKVTANARTMTVAAALAFISFAFVMAAPWRGAAVGLGLFNPPIYLWPADKTMLAPMRVINVLALLYLVAYFVAPQAGWLRSRIAAPFLACGRHSLPVYGAGVLLSSLSYIALALSGHTAAVDTAVNVLGVLATFLIGSVLEARREARQTAARIDSHPPLALVRREV
ncbi:MAG TPA: OpgC domain-containing protein [Candidatus Binataceae bacterium]|nr:OpgC domain-containing protein [Candidatus Binataceae bacterium]